MTSTVTGRSNLRADIRYSCDGDVYGNAMNWIFPIAQTLYLLEEDIPFEWDMKVSEYTTWEKVAREYSGETLIEGLITRDINYDDMRYWGNVLTRYIALLKKAGKDY